NSSRILSAFDFFSASWNSNFPGGGKQEQIRRPDSVNRGHKCHRNSPPHLIDVVQMLHDLNQSENGSDDPNRWGKSSGGFKDSGNVVLVLSLLLQFHLHHFSQLSRLGPIHGEHQRLPHERVLNL